MNLFSRLKNGATMDLNDESVIKTFDTIDEMNEYLDAANKAAHEHMAEAQKHLTYGNYWARFHDLKQRIVIFGKVMTLEENLASEIEHGAPADEAQESTRHVARQLDAGFMFGKCFSIVTPEGEYGSTHKAHAWPISKELYEAAEAARWDIDATPDTHRLLLSLAYVAMRDHYHAVGAE